MLDQGLLQALATANKQRQRAAGIANLLRNPVGQIQAARMNPANPIVSSELASPDLGGDMGPSGVGPEEGLKRLDKLMGGDGSGSSGMGGAIKGIIKMIVGGMM